MILPDLFFCRHLDAILSYTRQHYDWLDRNLHRVANETPMGQRGAEYKALLQHTIDSRSLISTATYRLGKFNDDQFSELGNRLNITCVNVRE